MRPLDWFLARRYLSSRKGGRLLSFITWIALGGVVVGVTALVVVIGVMTGMQEDLREKILATNPHVLVLEQGSTLYMSDWRTVLDTVRAVEGVVTASPFVLGNVVIRRPEVDYGQPAVIYGVDTDAEEGAPTGLEQEIRDGQYDLTERPSGLPSIILGSRLAMRLQMFRGDTVLVMSFENLTESVLGVLPTMRQFEMTGTFTTGMYDADMQNMYARLDDVQEFLGFLVEDGVSGVAVRTADANMAIEVSDAIQARLGLPYISESWTVTNQALFSALKLEKLAMFVILFLVVVVAAFNIISTLIMVVHDRTREIGILKSMGMTDDGILRVFMLQGAWIGVVGTVVGTTAGVVLCWLIDTFEIIRIPPEVYFVDRLPVELRPSDLLAIVAASLLVAFAATIYPALQASRLEPVEAIRSE